MTHTPPFAVVDIGSNSVRLFQVTSVDAGLPEGPRETHVIGLKRGAADDGTLAHDALVRLRQRLDDFGETVARAGLTEVIAVGTSAVRDAPNRADVGAALAASLGGRLVVLSGDHEARLSYRGARLARPRGRTAVLDVGGASTEIAVGSGSTPDTAVSVDLGVVRCHGGSIAGDPPGAGPAGALRSEVRRAIVERVTALPRDGALIGVAGTITSLAAIDIGRHDPRLVDGHLLSRDRLEALMVTLSELPLRRRRQMPGLHPDRAPVIVVGAAIALGAMDALEAERLTASERDLLDGVAAAVLEGDFLFSGEIS